MIDDGVLWYLSHKPTAEQERSCKHMLAVHFAGVGAKAEVRQPLQPQRELNTASSPSARPSEGAPQSKGTVVMMSSWQRAEHVLLHQ